MAKPPVSEQVQVNFRMPVPLRDRIKAAAEKNGNSMNAEIVDALTRAFPEPQGVREVLDDVALTLALVEPNLREKVIQALVEQGSSGKFSRWVEAQSHAHRDWLREQANFPWDDS